MLEPVTLNPFADLLECGYTLTNGCTASGRFTPIDLASLAALDLGGENYVAPAVVPSVARS